MDLGVPIFKHFRVCFECMITCFFMSKEILGITEQGSASWVLFGKTIRFISECFLKEYSPENTYWQSL